MRPGVNGGGIYMSEKFLHRDDAPFEKKVWQAIDEAVRSSAAGQLSARRLMEIEGPYGLGLKSIPRAEQIAAPESTDDIVVRYSPETPVALLSADFSLEARDIEAYESRGYQIDLSPAVNAARLCAEKEDQILLYGSKALGVPGLLTAKGVQQRSLTEWKEPGTAIDDIIGAVTALDNAGFHGPFSLALAPMAYNALFRRYPQGNTLEIEHIRALVTDGVIKSPSLKSGGVLLASSNQYASIVLGQDLMAGFEGPEGRRYAFFISESMALRLNAPEAVCVLKS
jgi:uncharacterized linocin/CFP29 family protein